MTESNQINPEHPTQQSSALNKGLKWLLGILGAVVIIYLGLVGIGAVLIVADPIEPVDAVVALSGDDGDRLALAIEMHENGIAPNLVITDTSRTANARLRHEALEGGFRAGDIYITESQVDSTLDEAQAVLELAQNQGWSALMVVTDPYHSLRTRVIFRQIFRGSGITILVRPVVGHWFRSPSWFFYPEGWRFVFLELIKFTFYIFGIK